MLDTARPPQVDSTLEEIRFAAMGSQVHVVAASAPTGALPDARAAVHTLERRWSRFRGDSEISRVNAAAGRTTTVSAATATLVALAVRGWQATGGAYDPTVLDALVEAGYDRSFDDLRKAPSSETHTGRAPANGSLPAGGVAAAGTSPTPSPGCAGITVDVGARIVRVPPGVRLDPGGIGKGLAADLAAATLLADGAAGALVNVGGDVRVAGISPSGGWRIDVELPGMDDAALALQAGAAATSSTQRRTWVSDGAERHHLIAPATGAPAVASFVAATVVAGSAWWAEVLTKAVMLAESTDAAALTLAAGDAAALVLDRDGRQHVLAGMDRFLR